MKFLINKIIRWPLCLILLLGIVQPKSGESVCKSMDGKIEVETECRSYSDDSEECCMPETGENQNEQDECSDCFDLTLDLSILIVRSDKHFSEFEGKNFSVCSINQIINNDENYSTNKYIDLSNSPNLTNKSILILKSIQLNC